MSPLHDSAGSHQSFDSRDGCPSSSDSGSPGRRAKEGHPQNPANGSSDKESSAPEQDTAHFVGFSQKANSSKARLDHLDFELCLAGSPGSFLPDCKEVKCWLTPAVHES